MQKVKYRSILHTIKICVATNHGYRHMLEI